MAVEKKGGYMKKKNIRLVPKFKNEDEEREFWATHDFTDYLDQFKEVKMDFSKLKPSTASVTIRLPQFLLEDLKRLANKKDVPYQSLMKIYLAQAIEKELRLHQRS